MKPIGDERVSKTFPERIDDVKRVICNTPIPGFYI
jgi:hypothetical protein